MASKEANLPLGACILTIPSASFWRPSSWSEPSARQLQDVVAGTKVELWDHVEFDIVEGSDSRAYGARVKKVPKDVCT